MDNIFDFKRVHFIGAGGVGTAPLMRIFAENGFDVSGSDMAESDLTEQLKSFGYDIKIGHSVDNLPVFVDGKDVLIVYSSAVDESNVEYAESVVRGYTMMRRGAALAAIADRYQRTVAVSGSHGKTSVCAMISWIMKKCNPSCGFLIGGRLSDASFNGESGIGNDIFITEADESDGTHTCLHPYIGIVTNVEDDHAWSLGGTQKLYDNFKSFAFNSTKLIYVASEKADELFSAHPDAIRIADVPDFAIFGRKKWGAYQKSNAYLAILACGLLGVSEREAENALEDFPGVDRRMSLRYDSEKVVVIEDYAHHPTELRASLAAIRETYPDRRIIALFQPHRYARLERYFNEFASELSKADVVFVAPVFAAWTAMGKYTSDDLADAVLVPCAALDGSFSQMADVVAQAVWKHDLVAVIGAGDIKEVVPELIRLFSCKPSCSHDCDNCEHGHHDHSGHNHH